MNTIGTFAITLAVISYILIFWLPLYTYPLTITASVLINFGVLAKLYTDDKKCSIKSHKEKS